MEKFRTHSSEKIKKNTIESLLRAGALAAMTTITGPHPHAEALELEPHISWNAGIEQARISAETERNEFQFNYIKTGEDEGFWLPPSEGSEGQVAGGHFQLAKDFSNESFEKICIGHTHTKLPDFEHAAIPPSYRDAEMIYVVLREFGSYGIPFDKIELFLTDPRGIWYFGRVQKEDFSSEEEWDMAMASTWSKEEKVNWYDTLVKFSQSTIDPDSLILGSEEYKMLQRAYRIYLTTQVRFVPYSQVDEEPPCAGLRFSE